MEVGSMYKIYTGTYDFHNPDLIRFHVQVCIARYFNLLGV